MVQRDGAPRRHPLLGRVRRPARRAARHRRVRLLLFKADGSVAVHSDAKAYKPLNWMNPPCTVTEDDGDDHRLDTRRARRLVIELHEVLFDETFELGDDPGLDKDGVEAELQELHRGAGRGAARRTTSSCGASTRPTSGPSTCSAATATGRAVVVEVKRIGEIAGVDQLLRYQERLDRDGTLAPTRGMFVATRIKPQARVYRGEPRHRVRRDRPRGAPRRSARRPQAVLATARARGRGAEPAPRPRGSTTGVPTGPRTSGRRTQPGRDRPAAPARRPA